VGSLGIKVADPYIVIGQAGTGSVPVEAALTLAGLPYRVEEVRAVDFGKHNPMRQIPALVTPAGELITESAAILIWLADIHPEAGLAPRIESPERAQFLRWMAFVSSAIYALYWIRDLPSRLAANEAQEALVRERTAERIRHCWSVMEAQVSPVDYLLGDRIGALDLYVTVLSRWGPRRKVFYEAAPKMAEVVRRVDAEPRLAALWAERFPFGEGWEG
jgi:GST-like protein